MNFSFTPEQEALRSEVRQFLRDYPGQDFPVQMHEEGYGLGAWSYEYARLVGEKGWISRFWPKEYGGQGAPLIEQLIRMEEFAYAEAPSFIVGFSETIAHVLMDFGNDFLKNEFLPRIARGDVTFWMALSEPDAGSDLLALKTEAKRDGDYYVINGQKTWSSRAHLADYAYLLVRTDPKAPRHKGLSMFVMDKNLPGVTVRPLYSLVGTHHHNELFLDDVRIHKDYLIGEENKGLIQMMKGLEFDRFWARFVKPPFCRRLVEYLAEYIAETTDEGGSLLANDPVVRRKLAHMATEVESCHLLFWRAGWMSSEGLELSYEGTLGKLLADEMGQRLFNLGIDIMGLYPRRNEDPRWDSLRQKFIYWYQSAIGSTLAGGTSEIIRNTIATRGLGMPRN